MTTSLSAGSGVFVVSRAEFAAAIHGYFVTIFIVILALTGIERARRLDRAR